MTNEEARYGGMVDNLIDGILDRVGIEPELIKKINSLVSDVMQHVESEQIGDETVFTIHLNKIHFKMKNNT